MFDLSGKSALVTGATSGIGQAIAVALHTQGALVAGVGRRAENLMQMQKELGERFFPLPCDLSDMNAVADLPGQATESLGEVSILVNSAGLTRDSLLMRLSPEAWEEVLSVNLTAAMILSQKFLRGMMKKRWGRIINITSIVAATGNPGQANYAASKAGLTGLTKSLAKEVASRNITVNAVAPGLIDTAMTEKLSDQQREVMISQIPMERPGRSEEIAAAVVFLSSDEASYITGATMHINGGMAML